jgi:hypothetical protein
VKSEGVRKLTTQYKGRALLVGRDVSFGVETIVAVRVEEIQDTLLERVGGSLSGLC